MYLYLPSCLNLTALPAPAKTTFLGFQVNLYFHGLSFSLSSANKPPVNDSNIFISAPWSRMPSINFIAERWSMPGSTPISFIKTTPASFALSFKACISLLMYDAVTMCFCNAIQSVAIGMCMCAGSIEITKSLLLISLTRVIESEISA